MTSLQVSLGFSSSAIGNILGLMRIATSFLSPAVSSYADTNKLQRSMMIAQSCIRIIPLIIMWVMFSWGGLSLWTFFLLNSLASILGTGIWPISDSLILASLDDKATYGKVRLWGALTYGLGNLVIGVLIQMFESFNPMFLMCILTLFPAIYVTATTLPAHASKAKSPTPITFSAIVSILTQSNSFKVFFVNSMIIGGALALVESLLFVAMERTMNGSNPIIAGASVFISVLFEIPIFQIAPSLIYRHGTKKMLIVANLAYIIRALGYATFSSAFVVLFLELFHGVSFGLYYSAAVHICVKQCPPGMDSTMQSLLDMTFSGIGVALGTIVGGYLFDLIGSSSTFVLFASIVAASTIALGLFFTENPVPSSAPSDPNGIALSSPVIGDALNDE